MMRSASTAPALEWDPLPGTAKTKALDPDYAVTISAWKKLIADRESIGLPDLKVMDPEDADIRWDLTPDDRVTIVDQAKRLVENFYPHLPFKKEDFLDADAAAALENIRSIVESDHAMAESGLDFHNGMHAAIGKVRDPHTAYIAPAAMQSMVSFLPFQVGFYKDTDQKVHYIVTDVMPHDVSGTDFVPGVEILSSSAGLLISDGPKATLTDFSHTVRISIAEQVGEEDLTSVSNQTAQALLTPGANKDSQLLRALQSLTVRPLATAGNVAISLMSFQPDVRFQYIPSPGAPVKDFVTRWVIASATGIGISFPAGVVSLSRNISDCHYALNVLFKRQHSGSLYGPHPQARAGAPVADSRSTFPDVFEFQLPDGRSDYCVVPPDHIKIGSGDLKIGYLAIKRFFSPNIKLTAEQELPEEFGRILGIFNTKARDGLILDIRSNPGGDITAAEKMLGMLTPRTIQPASFHMANTAAVLAVLDALKKQSNPDLTLQHFTVDAPAIPYDPSDEKKAPRLTPGHPLSPVPDGPAQVYQGPVVLLIDALTYSAADIFAGGFQDHAIGPVIGWDAQTGGGGASVYSLSMLAAILPDTGHGLIKSLPGKASLSVALLRSSRVGPNEGIPIEDRGVKADPDKVYPRTLCDLKDNSKDLIQFAGRVVAKLPVYRVDLDPAPTIAADGVHVSVTTRGIDRLDFNLEDKAVLRGVAATPGQTQTLVIPLKAPLSMSNPPFRLRVDGFSAPGTLAAVTQFRFAAAVEPTNKKKTRV
jgi:hypothetical protein